MVNYVIATWSGARRVSDPRYWEDAAFYLRHHLKYLEDVPHNLSQITVCVPHNPEEPAAFRQLLFDYYRKKAGGATIEILERPNVGLSYGSFSDAYARYRQQFDYYIFMEDDYKFCQPHFDIIMKELMAPTCGFICGYMHYAHAGVYLGMVRSSACEKIYERHGRLPYCDDTEILPPDLRYRANEQQGQIAQSRAFMEAGYELRHIPQGKPCGLD
jgi:hypothetical protein